MCLSNIPVLPCHWANSSSLTSRTGTGLQGERLSSNPLTLGFLPETSFCSFEKRGGWTIYAVECHPAFTLHLFYFRLEGKK